MNSTQVVRRRRWALATALAVTAALSVGCGGGGSAAAPQPTPGAVQKTTLRLGYFPNITHATALVGVKNGIFAKNLGSDTELKTVTFNAGPAAVEALFSGAIDATYIGPNPAINAFTKSNGEAIRIISGATSGGAFLVTKPDISAPAQLRGKKLATPQLGNTQDVALRAWLGGHGLKADVRGGGDVSITPQENAQTLETFRAGQIDGAWVPEPWATRLVQEGGGRILVDERDLWPNRQYVTTHLIVRTEYLQQNPQAVAALLRGHVEANDFVNADKAEAQRLTNEGIADITSKPLADKVIKAAWENLAFTVDPVADSLRKSAHDAKAAGLLQSDDLEGIYDVDALNKVLADAGKPQVKVAG